MFHNQLIQNLNDFDTKRNFENKENDKKRTFHDSIELNETHNETKQCLSLLNFENEKMETDHQPLSLQEELQLLNEKLEENERNKMSSYSYGK